VARGQFGLAAVALGIASIGDAIDGDLARASGTVSPKGAIFDASADRYQEFFFLLGLAFFFRGDVVSLGLVLAALVGSFMVSYGSAKAEALRVPVPGSAMRRAERAACFVLGTAFVAVLAELVRWNVAPSWLTYTPILSALALVGVVSNVSAIYRLRTIGRSAEQTPFLDTPEMLNPGGFYEDELSAFK